MSEEHEAAPDPAKIEKAREIVHAWRNEYFRSPASAVGDSYFAAEPHLIAAIAAFL